MAKTPEDEQLFDNIRGQEAAVKCWDDMLLFGDGKHRARYVIRALFRDEQDSYFFTKAAANAYNGYEYDGKRKVEYLHGS